MKKNKLIAALTLAAFMSVNFASPFAASANETETKDASVYFEDDFESYEDGTNAEVLGFVWGNGSESTNATVQTVDGRKALKISGRIDSALYYNFLEENATTGKYRISFDLRMDTANSELVIDLPKVKTDISSRNFRLMTARGGGISSGVPDRYISLNLNNWYSFKYEMDLDSQTVKEIMDNNGAISASETAAEDAQPNLKDCCDLSGLGTFRLRNWANGGTFYLDNLKIERLVSLELRSITSDNPGNIFGKDEAMTMNLNYKNISDYDITAGIEAYATDADENVVWTGSYSADAKVNEEVSVPVEVTGADKFGLYTLHTKTTSVYPEDSGVSPKTDEKKIQFSRAWKVAKEDINQKFGTALLIPTYKWSAPNGVAAEMAGNAGLGWNREEIQWKACETSPGSYELPEEARKELEAARDKGIKNHLGLVYSNPIWYDNWRWNADAPTSDKELEAYGNWCEWLARETKGLVQAFGVWNEYNIANFNAENEPAEHFATIQKVAYEAIKRGNPDALVLGMEEAGISNDFNRRVFDAGGYDYMDVAAVHPYDWSGHFNTKSLIKASQELRDMMAEYGEPKPVWFTEMGFNYRFTYQEQASNMVMLYNLQQHLNVSDNIYQFRFQDTISEPIGEATWGLCLDYRDAESPNAAKPSYLAVCAMNNLLGPTMAEPVEYIQNGVDYAFRYKNNRLGKDIAVIQGEYDSTYRAFDLGCTGVEIYDYYGNKLYNMTSENGIYGFSVGVEPIYVVGNFTKFAEVDAANAIITPLKDSESVAFGDAATFSFVNNSNRHLTISNDDNPYVTVEKNDGFINGRADIVYRVSTELTDSTDVRINIKDDEGNVVYNANHSVSVDPLDVTLATEEASGANHWRVAVTVKNNSNQQTVSGKVEVTAPEKEAAFIAPRDFKNLAPGESATIYLNLPPRIIKKTIDLKLNVSLTNGHSEEVGQLLDFSSAQYAYKKPVIDGKYDSSEWTGNWFGADEKMQWGSDASAGNKPWNGPEDASFAGIAMWDEENFYILIDATDDVFYNTYEGGASYLWRTDSIQFAIDDRDDLNPVGKNSFTEIGIAEVPGEGPVIWRYNAFYDLKTGLRVENGELAVNRTDDGHTIYECRIPWSELIKVDFVPVENQVIRYSIIQNDSDSDARGWMMYNDGIAASKNLDLFGRMVLKK